MRWLALGAAGLMLAAACAGSSSNPASTTTITFWYLSDGTQADQVFQDAAKGFHAAHPDVEVHGTKLSSDTAYSKMLAALKGGGGPDAMEVSRDWLGAFSATAALHELSSDEVQRLGGATAFVPGTWTTGKATAIPWFVDEKALYYRTDILHSVGLDPAAAFASWDALQSTLSAMQDAGQAHPLGLGKGDASQVDDFAPWIWGAGGSLLSADGTKATINQPLSVNGVDEYQRLAGKFSDPAALQQSDSAVEAMFAAGKFAVTLAGPRLATQLRGNFAVAPFPQGPAGRIVYAGGSDLAILAASKHASAAYEWARWLAGQDGETSYVPRLSMYPALAAASDSMSNVQFWAFKAQVGAGKSFPAIASWSAIDSVLGRYFAQVWNQVAGGGQPVPKDQLATMLDKAAGEMQAAIQQPS